MKLGILLMTLRLYGVQLPDGVYIRDCFRGNAVDCPAFTFYEFTNGTYLLMPPPVWISELVWLVETNFISHKSARVVLDCWRDETMNRIETGINKLLSMMKQ